jgi:lysyl-tRNA synthetase class 2
VRRLESLRAALELRARLYALIREFFAARGVMEVETPVLSAGAKTEPNIASFATRFSGHADSGPRERWLRTSSEFAQKRLLAAGVGDNYELGRVFRDGEAGRRHNPEFTMLEWYRTGWDHRRLADETVALVQAALALSAKRADRLSGFVPRGHRPRSVCRRQCAIAVCAGRRTCRCDGAVA